MLINAFSPQTLTVNEAVTTSAATLAPAYGTNQLTAYRLVNAGTAAVFVLFGTATVVTAANGIPILANTETVLTGPPNAVLQAIAAATGSTLYMTAGEGL